MWLSTTLFLTQGLLLVHVSVVSCAYQWGYSPITRTSSYLSRPNQPNNPRIMTSDEAFARYAGDGARLYTGRPDDDIERQAGAVKLRDQEEQAADGAFEQPRFRPVFGRIAIFPSADILQKLNPMLGVGVPNNLYPRRSEYSPSDLTTIIYTSALPTANQPFSLFSPSPQSGTPLTSPYTPSSSSYYTPPVQSRSRWSSNGWDSFPSTDSSLTDEYSTPPNPYKRVPNRWSSNRWVSFPSTDSALTDKRNAQQNPSNGQSTSSSFGSPLTQDLYSFPSTQSQLPRRSPLTQSEPLPTQNLFGSPPTKSKPLSSIPSRSSSTQSDPMLNSGAQTNSPEKTNLVTPAGKKKQYTFGPDGRRLAGRQNATWPELGTWTNTSDAGIQLGDSFKGILMPQMYIDRIKKGLNNVKGKATGDTRGHFEREVYSFPTNDPNVRLFCDGELVEQAIREAQGDYDTYDDPWTNESIYSDEVMALNKRLHNEYRAKHYAQPLEYMEEIHPVSHSYANFMAKEVALYGLSRFQHNTEVLKKRNWGENLYTINSRYDRKSPAVLVQEAIDGWYEEVNRYAYFGEQDANIEEPLTGHFTCLVWRSTERMGLGIGKYTARNITQYVVVVNYDPAGNIRGRFDVNVIKAGTYDGKEDKLPPLGGQWQMSDGGLGSLFGFH